jgi:methyl-accepting chemotaxis protein
MIAQKEIRRKNYFIKKQFQGMFMLKFSLLMGLGLLISACGLYIYTRPSTTTSFINSRLTIISTSDYILPVLIWAGLAVFFVMAIITSLVVMYMSHRIAGAMFNIERSLNRIAEGDLTINTKLRSTDQLQEMAEGVNRIAKALSDRVSSAKESLSNIKAEIDKLEAPAAKEMNDRLKAVSAKIDILSDKLGYFKTK